MVTSFRVGVPLTAIDGYRVVINPYHISVLKDAENSYKHDPKRNAWARCTCIVMHGGRELMVEEVIEQINELVVQWEAKQ